jgi:ATP-dependent Clp protease ATP-binding subunit ClpA
MIERGLSKDKARNILLVGETGVGKSVVVAYLGRLGRSGLSFPGIHNHRVVELSVEGLALEDFDKSMNEAAKAGNVIVVIENIHEYEPLFFQNSKRWMLTRQMSRILCLYLEIMLI